MLQWLANKHSDEKVSNTKAGKLGLMLRASALRSSQESGITMDVNPRSLAAV